MPSSARFMLGRRKSYRWLTTMSFSSLDVFSFRFAYAAAGKVAAGVVAARSVFEQGMEVRSLRYRVRARVGVSGCRGLVRERAPAGSGRFRRKWAPISPWVLDFCAVFGEVCWLSASPTWGNVGVLRRFGSVQPAKPPRSCEWGLLALKVARLTCVSVWLVPVASIAIAEPHALVRALIPGRKQGPEARSGCLGREKSPFARRLYAVLRDVPTLRGDLGD